MRDIVGGEGFDSFASITKTKFTMIKHAAKMELNVLEVHVPFTKQQCRLFINNDGLLDFEGPVTPAVDYLFNCTVNLINHAIAEGTLDHRKQDIYAHHDPAQIPGSVE